MLFMHLAGCSPLTAYRNTLLIDPPAPPTSMGAPLGKGVVTVGGYAGVRDLADVGDLAPEEGDPGVFVPTTSLGAHLNVGLGRVAEVGGHLDYSAAEWSHASGVGVLPLADEDPLLGLGAHLTLGERHPRFGWGFTLDATWLSLPYARYTYTGPDSLLEDDVYVAGDGSEFYSLESSGTAHPVRIRATGAVTIPLGVVDLSPGVSFCPTFTNVGFTDHPSAVYKGGPLAVIPVIDAGVWVASARIGAQTWLATGARGASDGRDTGWGGRLALDWVPGKSPRGEKRPARAPWMPDPVVPPTTAAVSPPAP